MGKKRVNNTSKHIKTRHKKSLINRRVVTQKVDNPMKNINKIITDITNKQMQDKEKGSVENAPKIKAQ